MLILKKLVNGLYFYFGWNKNHRKDCLLDNASNDKIVMYICNRYIQNCFIFNIFIYIHIHLCIFI